MKKQTDKSVLITLIIVGGVILLALLGIGFLNSLNPSNTISSNGLATIKVVPNLAGIYFNVQTYGETSSEARDRNSEIVEKMKNSLIANGFEESEIQTQGFSIYPEYDYSNGENKIKRYAATHSIKIELSTEDSEKIGKAIDFGVDAGAGISYINFELSQEMQNQYKAQAIKMATEDAKIKAEALAEGAGYNLGKLVSISTSDFGYTPWMIFSATTGMETTEAKAATDIQPGEQEVSAQVTAVFRMR
ncbi:MAG: SIMPL domain-containing protein [Nanoarchaeota archaeon]